MKYKMCIRDRFDSICETTLERQKETESLAKKSDAVVVIGDRHSSNTRKLFEIAQKYCKNTFYVESAGEIALENFHNCGIISLVAEMCIRDRGYSELLKLGRRSVYRKPRGEKGDRDGFGRRGRDHPGRSARSARSDRRGPGGWGYWGPYGFASCRNDAAWRRCG